MVLYLITPNSVRAFTRNIKLFSLFYFLISLTLFPCVTSAGTPKDKLQHRIGQIKKENHSKANIGNVEKDYLKLLNEFTRAEEKGRIFVALGRLGGHGLDHTKAKGYCKEALKYPLDPLLACEMYANLGDYNEGLNFVNKYLTVTEKQTVPLVIVCNSPNPPSDNDPCWKTYYASLKAHDEAMFQNDLLMWRELFLKNLNHKK